jgi:hypothetical protein
MIGGADKGSFIPRHAQLVADFTFDKDVITPFGGEWDMLMCKFEEMFKEISNRSLGLRHALRKGDLWLADDLANDNYLSALDARADLEAERYARHTKCSAYKDKRQKASSNRSSVIAGLTLSAARHEKTWSDFYSKSDASASHTTSSVVVAGGGGSSARSEWNHPTISGPLAWTYRQPFFPGTYPHTNDPPNQLTPVSTGRGTGQILPDDHQSGQAPQTIHGGRSVHPQLAGYNDTEDDWGKRRREWLQGQTPQLPQPPPELMSR